MNGANPATDLASALPEQGLLGRLSGVRRSLSALSFWGAIALPALYLPLLLVGIDTTNGLVTFLLLFGLHVLALLGGRRYHGSLRR